MDGKTVKYREDRTYLGWGIIFWSFSQYASTLLLCRLLLLVLLEMPETKEIQQRVPEDLRNGAWKG